MALIIRDIKRDDGASFYCESEFRRLERFFNERAFNFNRLGLSKTLVALDSHDNEESIIGFISVGFSSIQLRDVQEILKIKGTEIECPAFLVGKLLVDERYRKSQIGTKLVMTVIGLAREVNKISVCRFVVTHAHKGAVSFYKKLGFREIADAKSETKLMVFDLQEK